MPPPIRPPHPTAESDSLPREVALAFAPLHKRAFGVAVGLAVGLLVFVVTAITLLYPPENRRHMTLLAEYFYGYTVSWPGALVGGFWGFVVGFVAGWFVAFCRNLVIAATLFITRTRAELAATRDFLDHI